MIRRLGQPIAVVLAVGTLTFCVQPSQARAVNLVKPICTLAGLVSTLAGKTCSAASHAGNLLQAGKKLLGGHLGEAFESLSGASTAVKAVTAGVILAGIVGWVTAGAKLVLTQTAKVISTTTRPALQSTWFSASYWRMAAIAALLTLPFLFAASIQAVMRTDMSLLLRSAFVYLPLGMLAVSIAAPLTMLLLAAADELSALISSASGGADASFLAHAGVISGTLSVVSKSAFIAFFVGFLTVAATITLWVELLIRSAAVYVIVLMLPLFFAALVWPARRVWAVRALELLVALILSKFAIVAVLSLGGAAIGHTAVPSAAEALEGATLVMLAAFSPWALMRLLPLHELAAGLDGMRARPQPVALGAQRAEGATDIARELVRQLPVASVQRQRSAPDEPPAAEQAVSGLESAAVSRPQSGAVSGLEGESDDPATGGSVVAADSDLSDSDRGSPGWDGSAGTAGTADRVARDPAPSPNASSASEPDRGPEPAQRLPGMEPRWQAENGSWGTLYAHVQSSLAFEHDAEFSNERNPPEDDDPLPPIQEPDGGRL